MSAEQLLSSVPHSDTIIVADLEAGIGTLTRLPEQAVEHTLVIVEPTPRSIDVGLRAVTVATERAQGHITVVANKIVDADDDARVRTAFDGYDVVAVPADPTIVSADRQGLSPMDVSASSPAVAAIGSLVSQLTGGRSHGAGLATGRS